jgi:hypothetical protein
VLHFEVESGTKNPAYKDVEMVSIGEEVVNHYNKLIFANIQNDVYANTQEVLETLEPMTD